MSKLAELIQDASQKYYSEGASPYTDEEFDKMISQLKSEDPNSPLLETGHGYDISKTSGSKVEHKYGLVGSLDKCHSWIEIPQALKDDFIKNHVIYSLKLDGLSVVLYYEDGKLIQAVTRGNGTTGIDITDKVKFIFMNQLNRIPEMNGLLLPKFTGAIRGEILMSNENFKEFQKRYPEAKNSRNSTAGIINSKEILEDLKFLDIIVYRVVGIESKIMTSSLTYSDILYDLTRNFQESECKVVHNIYRHIPEDSLDDDMIQCKLKWYNEWPADGIVITSNEIELIGNEVVYNSIAYKYPSEVKESTVVDILWDLSKTGYLIPRIQIEPVEISGSTVQFCTGIHAQAIKTCGVGPGSKIKITKANEIIPQMLEVVNKNPVDIPEVCPECGTQLVWNGVHLQCKNSQCKNQKRQDVLCWFNALSPLDGLGDTLILKYMEELFGDDISIEKIYETGYLNNTSNLVQKRLFVKAYNTLLSGPYPLESAIRALNIPRFGDITATKCVRFANEFKDFAENGKLSEKLKDLGSANYASLVEHSDKLARISLIKDNIDWECCNTQNKGEICITGKLSVKRSNFEAELKDAGFTISNSVKKNTSYLITDDPNSGTSKNAAANKYNVPKVSESEFRKTILQK